MKQKLKNYGVKILTMIICTLSLVSVLVVVPVGALPYNKDDLTYYKFRTSARYFERGSFSVNLKIESPTVMRAIFDYAYANNQKYTQDVYFNTLRVRIESGMDYYTELFYSYASFDFNDGDTVFIIRKDEEQSEFYTSLDNQSFNNNLPDNVLFSLQLLINLNTITEFNIESADENTSLNDILNSTYYLVEKQAAKTYSSGYIAGSDFGYEQGYGEGFDQGNIDGIQQGITEGYDQGYAIGSQDGFDEGYDEGYYHGNENGYNLGRAEGYDLGVEVGYSIGYADGAVESYDVGYADGEKDGWDNGFGAGQADMAETSESMKDMIFAIFDAPSVLIDGMLNFDIFGINLAATVKTILTLAVVAAITFVIIKFVKG